MSTCISREGEYSGHDLTLNPDDFRAARWTCSRCYAVDASALLGAMDRVRALADQWERVGNPDAIHAATRVRAAIEGATSSDS